MIEDTENEFGVRKVAAMVERRSRVEENQHGGVNATTDDVPDRAMLAGQRDQNDCSRNCEDKADTAGDGVGQLLAQMTPWLVHFWTHVRTPGCLAATSPSAASRPPNLKDQVTVFETEQLE